MSGLLAPAAPRRRFATDGVDAHEDGASNRVAVVDLTDGGSSGKIEVQNLTVQSDLRRTTMGQSLSSVCAACASPLVSIWFPQFHVTPYTSVTVRPVIRLPSDWSRDVDRLWF